MILSDVCDIAEIQQIARENGLAMTLFSGKRFGGRRTLFSGLRNPALSAEFLQYIC
ncbi:MAG: hypothetical protein R3C26_22650 [Calditrichia bacterium]